MENRMDIRDERYRAYLEGYHQGCEDTERKYSNPRQEQWIDPLAEYLVQSDSELADQTKIVQLAAEWYGSVLLPVDIRN